MEEISYKSVRKYFLAFMVVGMVCILSLSSTNVSAWSADVHRSPQSASRGETFTQSITIENTGSDSMKVDEISIHFGWMSSGEEYTLSGTPEVVGSSDEATFTTTVNVPTDIYEGCDYDVKTEITAYDPGFWGEWALSPDTKTYTGEIYIKETPEPTVSINNPDHKSELNTDEATVSWSGEAYDPESIDSYQIKLNGEGWIGVGSDTEYTFTNLEDKTHTVEVKITDSRGESNTDSVTFTVDTSTPPSRPRNLKPVEKDGAIDLTWDVPNTDGGRSITQYKIYRGTSSGDMTLLTEVSSTSYTDEDISEGETYYYEVSAVNSKGEGDTSEEASVTISSEGTGDSIPNAGIIGFIISIVVVVLFMELNKRY
ncbi:MAG: fibronectin type III domain-containing protein [Candidatus Saliniplasma sp.]